MQLNFLILLYNSSTARKHLFNLLCTPSRPNACKAAQSGKVGKRLDNESAIKPDTSDKVVSRGVGRPPFVSASLYSVCECMLRTNSTFNAALKQQATSIVWHLLKRIQLPVTMVYQAKCQGAALYCLRPLKAEEQEYVSQSRIKVIQQCRQHTKSFAVLFSVKAARECPLRWSQTLYLSQMARSLAMLSQCPVNTEPASASTSRGVTLFDCVSSAKRRSKAETSILYRDPNIVLCGMGLTQWSGRESCGMQDTGF